MDSYWFANNLILRNKSLSELLCMFRHYVYVMVRRCSDLGKYENDSNGNFLIYCYQSRLLVSKWKLDHHYQFINHIA